MIRWRVLLALAPILALLTATAAIEVAPGSACSALCLDSEEGDVFATSASTTNSSDIVCEDGRYDDSEKGKKYRQCISCLAASRSFNGTESDALWLLYNSRFAVTSCLFDFPAQVAESNVDTTCLSDDKCGALKSALIDDELDPDSTDHYRYCQADGEAFVGHSLQPCLQCLRESSEQSFLANFIVVLTGGCAFKPTGHDDSFSVVGSLFSREEVELLPPESRTDKSSRNSSRVDATRISQPASGGLAKDAIGAIIGGIGSVFILALVLFWFYCHQQRKHKRAANGPIREIQHFHDGFALNKTFPHNEQPQQQNWAYNGYPTSHQIQDPRGSDSDSSDALEIKFTPHHLGPSNPPRPRVEEETDDGSFGRRVSPPLIEREPTPINDDEQDQEDEDKEEEQHMREEYDLSVAVPIFVDPEPAAVMPATPGPALLRDTSRRPLPLNPNGRPRPGPPLPPPIFTPTRPAPTPPPGFASPGFQQLAQPSPAFSTTTISSSESATSPAQRINQGLRRLFGGRRGEDHDSEAATKTTTTTTRLSYLQVREHERQLRQMPLRAYQNFDSSRFVGSSPSQYRPQMISQPRDTREMSLSSSNLYE